MHYKPCVLFLCYSFVLHSTILGIGVDSVIPHQAAESPLEGKKKVN